MKQSLLSYLITSLRGMCTMANRQVNIPPPPFADTNNQQRRIASAKRRIDNTSLQGWQNGITFSRLNLTRYALLLALIFGSVNVWGEAATLPVEVSFSTGKNSLPTGFTASGLGSDYSSSSHSPYLLKFDSDNDFLLIEFDKAASVVELGVKMIGGGISSSFDVQGSITSNGTFTSIETLSISGNQNTIVTVSTTKAIDPSYRFIKLLFKKGSNVGLGNVSITAAASGGDTGGEAGGTSNTYTLTSSLTNGDYVFGAIRGAAGTDNVIGAPNATADASWGKYTEVTPVSSDIITADNTIVWTLTNLDGGGFTLQNKSSGKYLKLGTGTGSGSVSLSDTESTIYVSVAEATKSTFELHAISSATESSGNQLGLNGTSGYRMYQQRTHETEVGKISTQIRFYKAGDEPGGSEENWSISDVITNNGQTYTPNPDDDTRIDFLVKGIFPEDANKVTAYIAPLDKVTGEPWESAHPWIDKSTYGESTTGWSYTLRAMISQDDTHKYEFDHWEYESEDGEFIISTEKPNEATFTKGTKYAKITAVFRRWNCILPVIIEPATKEVGDEINFVEEMLYLSDNQLDPRFTCEQEGGDVTNGIFSATQGGEYTIRVEQEASRDYCAVDRTFKVCVRLAKPQNLQGNITGTTATLKWNDVLGAKAYTVTLMDKDLTTISLEDVTTNQCEVSNLSASAAPYIWTVRAIVPGKDCCMSDAATEKELSFVPSTFTITPICDPTEGGSISIEDDKTTNLNSKDELVIKAIANKNYIFTGWTCEGAELAYEATEAENMLTVGTSNITLTAHFESTLPYVNVTGTLNPFTYPEGDGPSAAQSLTISAGKLTENLMISAENYVFCEEENGTYKSSLYLTPSSGVITDKPIYIKLVEGLSQGNYDSDLTFTHTSVSITESPLMVLDGAVTAALTKYDIFYSINGSEPLSVGQFAAGKKILEALADVSVTVPDNCNMRRFIGWTTKPIEKGVPTNDMPTLIGEDDVVVDEVVNVYAVFAGIDESSPSNTYTKITSVDDLTAGHDYLIVGYSSSTYNALSNSITNGAAAVTEVSPNENDVITIAAEDVDIIWKLRGSANNWSWYNQDKTQYCVINSSNKLELSTTASSYTVSVADGIFSFKNGSYYLSYYRKTNGSQIIFNAYNESANTVYLYKRNVTEVYLTECDDCTNPEASVTNGKCYVGETINLLGRVTSNLNESTKVFEITGENAGNASQPIFTTFTSSIAGTYRIKFSQEEWEPYCKVEKYFDIVVENKPTANLTYVINGGGTVSFDPNETPITNGGTYTLGTEVTAMITPNAGNRIASVVYSGTADNCRIEDMGEGKQKATITTEATAQTLTVTFERDYGGQTEWVLVTYGSTLNEGDELIIAYNGSIVDKNNTQKGCKTATDIQSDKYLGSVESTFSPDKNTIVESADPKSPGEGTIIFELGGSAEDGWTLKKQGTNSMLTLSSSDIKWTEAGSTWTISIDESNNASIVPTANDGLHILYNSGSPRFKTYSNDPSSSMLLPQLYRKERATIKHDVTAKVYVDGVEATGEGIPTLTVPAQIGETKSATIAVAESTGYTFAGWEIDAASVEAEAQLGDATLSSTSLTMGTAAVTLIAHFIEGEWQLVIANNFLQANDEVVIADNSNANPAVACEAGTNKLTAHVVHFSDGTKDKITYMPTTAQRLTLGYTENKKWTFSNASNALLGANKDNDGHLNFASDNTMTQWSMTLTSSPYYATISVIEENQSRTIYHHNLSSSVFGAYTNKEGRNNVQLYYKVNTNPRLLVAPQKMTDFTYQDALNVTEHIMASEAQQITSIKGENLTGNVTITASEKYEISYKKAEGFTNEITVPQEDINNKTVQLWVRLKSGYAEGEHNGTITVKSSGAQSRVIELVGEVTAPRTLTGITAEPTVEEYEINSSINPATDVTVTATFDDNTTANVTAAATFFPNTFSTVGNEVLVTVSYTHNKVTETATYDVRVYDPNATYTITYHNDGGESSETVRYGEMITQADPTVCSGYTFVGWTEATSIEDNKVKPAIFDRATSIKQDYVLYAVFEYTDEVLQEVYKPTTVLPAVGETKEYILVDEKDGNYYAVGCQGTTQTSGSLPAETITVTDETIFTAIDNILWEIQNFDGAYYLRNHDGHYFVQTNTNGTTCIKLTTTATPTTITILNGLCKIGGTNDRYLGYSTNFRMYSGDEGVTLYTLTEVSIPTTLYTLDPNCDPDLVAEELQITSTKDVSITAKGQVTAIRTATIPTVITAEITGEAKDLFAVTVGDMWEVDPENGENHITTYTLTYTPTAYGPATHTANITFTISYGEETLAYEVLATGYRLPEQFVIASTSGENWVALDIPVDNSSANTFTGVSIAVDANDNPEKVTSAVTAAHVYSLVDVNAKNDATSLNQVRFQQVASNGYLWSNASQDGKTINVGSKSGESEQHNYEWTITTENGIDYTVYNKTRGYYLGLQNGDWGVYPTATLVRFLPYQLPSYEKTVVDWGKYTATSELGVTLELATSICSTFSITDNVGTVTKGTPINNNDGTLTFKITNLNDKKCTDLILVTRDANNVINSSTTLRVPVIVSASKTTTEAFKDLTAEVCAICDVVVKTNAASENVTILTQPNGVDEKNKTIRDLYIYPNAKMQFNQAMSVRSVIMRSEGDVVPHIIFGDATGALTPTDSLRFTKRIRNDRFYFFSVPYECKVDDMHFRDGTGVYGTDFMVVEYDGARRSKEGSDGYNWKTVPVGGVLKPGKGYNVASWYDVKKEIVFPMVATVDTDIRTLDQENKEVSVSPYGVAEQSHQPNHLGWNLVAHPYLTHYGTIDDENIMLGYWTKNQYGGADKWKEDGQIYLTLPYVDENNVVTTYDQKLASLLTIPPFSAFFIQVGTEGDGTLNFVKGNVNPALFAPRYASRTTLDAQPIYAGISLSNGIKNDETTLVIGNQFTQEYEIGSDLEKMLGLASKPQVYIFDSKYQYAFKSLDESDAANVNMLGVYLPADGEYTFDVMEAYDLSGVQAVYLTDNVENVTVNLLNAPYTFTNPKEHNTTRFTLSTVLAPKDVTDLTHAASSTWSLWQDASLHISLQGLTVGDDVRVIDATGKLVDRLTATDTSAQFNLPAAGSYCVQTIGTNGMQVKKIVVR